MKCQRNVYCNRISVGRNFAVMKPGFRMQMNWMYIFRPRSVAVPFISVIKSFSIRLPGLKSFQRRKSIYKWAEKKN